MHGFLQLPKNMSSLAKDLVRKILVVDPNMRLEISDIKQHNYVLMQQTYIKTTLQER